jgi:hypothetical protein
MKLSSNRQILKELLTDTKFIECLYESLVEMYSTHTNLDFKKLLPLDKFTNEWLEWDFDQYGEYVTYQYFYNETCSFVVINILTADVTEDKSVYNVDFIDERIRSKMLIQNMKTIRIPCNANLMTYMKDRSWTENTIRIRKVI